MTAQPAAEWTPPHVEPLDPDSDTGRAVAEELSEVFADVQLRLAREAVTAGRTAAHSP
jgi:hypothetical protein